MSTKGMTFKKSDIVDKDSDLTIYKINQLVRKNIDQLRDYAKLDDISILKKGYYVKYIKLNVNKTDATLRSGQIESIEQKGNGDYFITIKSTLPQSWNLLYSRIIIFYRAESVLELRKKKAEEWKTEFKNRDPIGYAEWQKNKKIKNAKRESNKGSKKKSIKIPEKEKSKKNVFEPKKVSRQGFKKKSL